MRMRVGLMSALGLGALMSLLFGGSFYRGLTRGSSAESPTSLKSHAAAPILFTQGAQTDNGQATVKDMKKKTMTPDEILEVLRQGKRDGFVFGDIPEDDEKARELAIVLHKELTRVGIENQNPSNPGTESGRQDLILMRQPQGVFDHDTDQALGIFLGGPEWSAIFYDVLDARTSETFVPGDNINEWTEKHRVEFQAKLPNYRMLGRIWDTYINVNYQPEEITKLREECLKVKSSTTNPLALQGLDKLIYACQAALKSGLGLHLAAD
jgi:hypothetical protein